jgi:pimeloyl-ACP methyl ester carboxylesterase
MPVVDLHGNQLHFQVTGSGRETIIAVHCSLSSGDQWRGLAAAFGASHRVVAPDLLGEGRSPEPGLDRSIVERDLRTLEALLPDDGSPAHLVGHSYGGLISVIFARRNPSRVASLVAYEVTPPPPRLLSPTSAAAIESVRGQCREAYDAGDHLRATEIFVSYWSGVEFWRRVPAPMRAEMAKRIGRIVVGWDEMVELDGELASMRDFAVPTLILAGAQSPLPSLQFCRALAERIPRCTWRVLPTAGHAGAVTHAREVSELIGEFYRGVASVERVAA